MRRKAFDDIPLLVDAQAKAGGMPQRMIDEKVFQFTPAEIAQARQDRSDEAFEQPAAV